MAEMVTVAVLMGKAEMSVSWDIENFQIPKVCDTHAISQNISSALIKMKKKGVLETKSPGMLGLICIISELIHLIQLQGSLFTGSLHVEIKCLDSPINFILKFQGK
ncbi:unnamed protein product [Prunus armeniaca]